MNSNLHLSKLDFEKKDPKLGNRKVHKIEVKLHFRRIGDMERARVHALLYQALPLDICTLFGSMSC
uniref:Uncharacterized protein n=1 Tax=Helianthus annuus TaxID=4232 RepID=A0A251RZX3_HELAN